MIPVLDYSNILQMFSQIIQFIRIKRICRQKFIEDENISIEIIMIIHLFLEFCANWLHLLQLLMRFRRTKKKSRRYFKPHLLIQILAGYRFAITTSCWHICHFLGGLSLHLNHLIA